MVAEMEEQGRQARLAAEEVAQVKIDAAEAAARLRIEEAEQIANAEKASAAAHAEERERRKAGGQGRS